LRSANHQPLQEPTNKETQTQPSQPTTTTPDQPPTTNQPTTSPESEGRAALKVRLRNVSALAHRLAAEASEGADAPLPLVLPHTRMLAALQDRGGWWC